jgi:hypothetical protein
MQRAAATILANRMRGSFPCTGRAEAEERNELQAKIAVGSVL